MRKVIPHPDPMNSSEGRLGGSLVRLVDEARWPVDGDEVAGSQPAADMMLMARFYDTEKGNEVNVTDEIETQSDSEALARAVGV